MPELQLVWLHPWGWTLLVIGGTLALLTANLVLPPVLRRRLMWIFVLIAVVGVGMLAVYFVRNQGTETYDVDPAM
ncbi:MAG: hypothetical protein ABI743_01565 [bacterium]